MLANLNIWADVLATGMVFVAVLFWIFQIVGNTITGRFKQKFRYEQWPEHDEVIPVFPRLLHFIHILTMIALAVSGLYIRFPVYSGIKPLMQQIHFYNMYLVIIIVVVRIIYAIFKDKHEFAVTGTDLKIIPQVLMYYLFLRKQYPHIYRYNGLQKIIYGYIFPITLILMALTGFSMIWPKQMLGWLGGSQETMLAYARVSHFFLAATIITIILVHICLSFVEDYPALLIFFGLRRQYWEEHEEQYYEDDEYFDGDAGPALVEERPAAESATKKPKKSG